MDRAKRVLFLCTGNSARSQMAEGWLRRLGGEDFEAFSAGTDPKGVNPLSIRVMLEAGVDISRQASKHLDTYINDRFDFVVTVCDRANEACPTFPGDVERIHWSFDDPADPAVPEPQRLQTFRRVRDEIEQQVGFFVRGQRQAGATAR
jgi:arsenate reductase